MNRDELVKVATRSNYTGLDHLWLPRTVLMSDFVVSMPKIKTHHWAGVTLGMKNMFGIVPGSKYGWPKNLLHWKGIHRSILDICTTAPVNFVIADRKDRPCRRSRSRGFHVCAPDGSRSISCPASLSGCTIPRKWLL